MVVLYKKEEFKMKTVYVWMDILKTAKVIVKNVNQVVVFVLLKLIVKDVLKVLNKILYQTV